jgi:hypothetical protein
MRRGTKGREGVRGGGGVVVGGGVSSVDLMVSSPSPLRLFIYVFFLFRGAAAFLLASILHIISITHTHIHPDPKFLVSLRPIVCLIIDLIYASISISRSLLPTNERTLTHPRTIYPLILPYAPQL